MDGIVITEWRYPHSVKLEKGRKKPPTGTGGKERVVVMAIGVSQTFRERGASEFFFCFFSLVCVWFGLGGGVGGGAYGLFLFRVFFVV